MAYSIDEDELVMDHVVRSASPNYFQIAGNTAIAGAKRASAPIKRWLVFLPGIAIAFNSLSLSKNFNYQQY